MIKPLIIAAALLAGPAAILLADAPVAAQEAPPAPAGVPANGAAARPASETETLRAELAETQARLARQQLVVDNARSEVQRLREEARLKDELLVLGRERNAEMLTLGREILERYKRKGLGAVITGSEPFVQASRVKLENLAQDYEDKLRAARFTADTLPPSVEARMNAELDTAAPAPTPDAAAPADPATTTAD